MKNSEIITSASRHLAEIIYSTQPDEYDMAKMIETTMLQIIVDNLVIFNEVTPRDYFLDGAIEAAKELNLS